MRPSFSLLAVLVLLIHAATLSQWTPPIQVTLTNTDDIHPSFANSTSFSGLSVEWLAFSRSTQGGSNICVMKTEPGAMAWADTVYAITSDSASNDYPSLARAYFGPSDFHLMIVWQRSGNIFYRFNPDSDWRPMQPVMILAFARLSFLS